MLDFGVEIEFTVPTSQSQHTVAAALSAVGIVTVASNYSHATTRHWKTVYDGSITPERGRLGMELVSPVLNAATGFDAIRKVAEVLAALDAKTNASTGLHVHFGVRGLDVAVLKRLASFYVEHEELFDKLHPASRRNHTFAQSNKARTNARKLASAASIEDIVTAVQGGHRRGIVDEARRVKLNFQAFFRHGTVEFRQAAGTVKADKIIKWVTLTSRALELAIKEAGAVVTSLPPAYWNRGKTTRIIRQLLIRPEGVTTEEARVALGIQTRPSIGLHLGRTGEAFVKGERRGGHPVFRLTTQQPAPTSPPVNTLEGLFERLELTAEDKAWWENRAARLARAQNAQLAMAGVRSEAPRVPSDEALQALIQE